VLRNAAKLKATLNLPRSRDYSKAVNLIDPTAKAFPYKYRGFIVAADLKGFSEIVLHLRKHCVIIG
jgi:hypothetical protein